MKTGMIAIVGLIAAVAVIGGLFFSGSFSGLQTGPTGTQMENEGSQSVPPTTNGDSSGQNEDVSVTDEATAEVEPSTPQTHTVNMSSSGFDPKTLTIKKGDTVVWFNTGTQNHWPASNVHPSHTVYPGSSINKCGTAQESDIFDACMGIAPGERYSFTFNEAGSWGYHDHLNTIRTGTIIVQ
jgi:plastocyanin